VRFHYTSLKPLESMGEECEAGSEAATDPAPTGMADPSGSLDAAFQIQCDACQEWVVPDEDDEDGGITPENAEQFERYHCPACRPYHGPSRRKRAREGLRKRKRIDFVKLNDASLLDDESGGALGIAAGDVQEIDYQAMLRQRQKRGLFRRGSGSGGCILQLGPGEVFDEAYADAHGFDRPVLLADKTPEEIGLRVPPKGFAVADVAALVGKYRAIPAIDTKTQLTTEYTLQEWVEYLSVPVKERDRVFNVISLEFSKTPLGELVTEPKFARDVDFVNLHWPTAPSEVTRGKLGKTAQEIAEGMEELEEARPRVQKYCLMSAAGSWTDFHVDFGGTSVWYHLFKGTKLFYFVEPTPQNLKIFSRWATNKSDSAGGAAGGGGGSQSKRLFLPDLIAAAGGECFEVIIKEGQSLFIPSGWIHAVYTPFDSLVFGGNFVHRYALDTQLTIYRLERQMKVGREFRFPNYMRLMWYAGRDFLWSVAGENFRKGKSVDGRIIERIPSAPPLHVWKGVRALAKELVSWSKSKQKVISDQHPPSMDTAEVKWVAAELDRLVKTHLDNISKKEAEVSRREKEVEAKKKKAEESVRKASEIQRRKLEKMRRARERQDEKDRKRIEKEKKKAARVLKQKEKLQGKIEDVHWLQCDSCNEWREVPLEFLKTAMEGKDVGEEQRSFYCSDINEECKHEATKWFQCAQCQAWHAVPEEKQNEPLNQRSGMGRLLCETMGKSCAPKRFQVAEIVLTR